MKIINILYCIYIIGCSYSVNNSHFILLGISYGGDCNLNKMPTLVLDPDWDESQVKKIRLGAKQWEEAVGVDLGILPISNVDCGSPIEDNWVPGCIVKVSNVGDFCTYDDKFNIDCVNVKTSGIVIGCEDEIIEQISAHEIGHWIGVHHINNFNALMYKYAYQNKVTEIDIEEYEKKCL